MPVPLLLIDTDAVISTAADVVVIGGGIIGTSAAYYLARRGVKVALVENGRIGAEQCVATELIRDEQYTRAVVSSQEPLMRFLDASRG